jgi:hypothetical protein
MPHAPAIIKGLGSALSRPQPGVAKTPIKGGPIVGQLTSHGWLRYCLDDSYSRRCAGST